MTETILQKIKTLPSGSGIYLMKNRGGEIIYVGKATNLKKRVTSYFQGRDFPQKIQVLVSQIVNIDYVETHTPSEALLLEYELIKRFRPRYNVMYRDDKSYPYLKLTVKEKWPRLLLTRIVRRDGSKYYGPYPDGSHLRKILHYVRKYFPLRYCKKEKLPQKACFYYHLKRCYAPCIGQINTADYSRVVKEIDLFLKNKHHALLRYLNEQMSQYSKNMQYEQAQRVFEEREFIAYLLSRVRFRKVDPATLLKIHITKISQEQILPLLKEVLQLNNIPRKIEAFDISNLSGRQAVGSMVTFVDGSPVKNLYRRFRIKTITGIDDYAMMGEVVSRRYGYLKKENKELPDLILIDGGKGHLQSAHAVLKKLHLEHIPIISIAKRQEHIFLPVRSEPTVLDRRSPVLHLVTHIRDEAHRFAVSYHRLLRKKAVKL